MVDLPSYSRSAPGDFAADNSGQYSLNEIIEAAYVRTKLYPRSTFLVIGGLEFQVLIQSSRIKVFVMEIGDETLSLPSFKRLIRTPLGRNATFRVVYRGALSRPRLLTRAEV